MHPHLPFTPLSAITWFGQLVADGFAVELVPSIVPAGRGTWHWCSQSVQKSVRVIRHAPILYIHTYIYSRSGCICTTHPSPPAYIHTCSFSMEVESFCCNCNSIAVFPRLGRIGDCHVAVRFHVSFSPEERNLGPSESITTVPHPAPCHQCLASTVVAFARCSGS